MLCRKLWPKPRFLSASSSSSSSSSSSWLISQLRFDRNPSPATHFFSTEASESSTEEGKELLYSPNNPQSSVGCSTPHKVELTKTLLKEYGFTNAHLSKLQNQCPELFNSFPAPELEFFRGIGFSNTDLPSFICSNPSLLTCSLQKQLVPSYNSIRGLVLSDEDVVKTVTRSPRVIARHLQKNTDPNIASLREAGVPESRILYFLLRNPSALGTSSMAEGIKKATEMGFNPKIRAFFEAVTVFTAMPKPIWDMKMEVLRKCGMTDAQILMAFKLKPLLMNLANGNIREKMDFLVKKMGWKPADVAMHPTVFGYSLEKRIIPRCTVVRYLQRKGLLSKNISLSTVLSSMNEKVFLDNYVKRYENDIPELMDIYLGKISPQEPNTLIK